MRSARAKNGKSRAPLATKNRKVAKRENAIIDGFADAAIEAPFGPPSLVVRGPIGTHLGHKQNPDK